MSYKGIAGDRKTRAVKILQHLKIRVLNTLQYLATKNQPYSCSKKN